MKIQEKEQQLYSKDEDITALRNEIEAKNRQLQDKDNIIKTKDEIISAKLSSLLSAQLKLPKPGCKKKLLYFQKRRHR